MHPRSFFSTLGDIDYTDLHTILNTIKRSCTEAACTSTRKTHPDFDPIYYQNNESPYRTSNEITRTWHNSFIATFDEIWKPKLELARKNGQITPKGYTQICFEIKHYLIRHIYSKMADTNGLILLQEKNYNEFASRTLPTFDWLIRHQMDIQKMGFEEQHHDRPFNPKPLEEGGDFDMGQAYRNTINLLTIAEYWRTMLNKLGLAEYNQTFRQLIEKDVEPLVPTLTASTSS